MPGMNAPGMPAPSGGSSGTSTPVPLGPPNPPGVGMVAAVNPNNNPNMATRSRLIQQLVDLGFKVHLFNILYITFLILEFYLYCIYKVLAQ